MRNRVAESKQQRQVERVLVKAIETASAGERRGEVKTLSVTPLRGRRGDDLFIQVETGMAGDEGTMASVFCRTYGAFIVTARGSLRATHCRKGEKTNARRFPMIYGFVSDVAKTESLPAYRPIKSS